MSFFDKLGAAFNDPKYAGLMGMGEGLMAAGGAHRLPVSMGQALAMGLHQSHQQAQQAQQAQAKQQIQQAKLSAFHHLFGGQPPASNGYPVGHPANNPTGQQSYASNSQSGGAQTQFYGSPQASGNPLHGFLGDQYRKGEGFSLLGIPGGASLMTSAISNSPEIAGQKAAAVKQAKDQLHYDLQQADNPHNSDHVRAMYRAKAEQDAGLFHIARNGTTVNVDPNTMQVSSYTNPSSGVQYNGQYESNLPGSVHAHAELAGAESGARSAAQSQYQLAPGGYVDQNGAHHPMSVFNAVHGTGRPSNGQPPSHSESQAHNGQAGNTGALTTELAPNQSTYLKSKGSENAKYLQGLQDAADSAVNTNYSLDQMNQAITGFTPGPFSGWRQKVESVIGGLGQQFGIAPPKSVSSYQEFEKYANKIAFAATRQMGSREAAQIVHLQMKSNPNAQLTPDAIHGLSHSMKAMNNYIVTKNEVFQDWAKRNNGDTQTLQARWNREVDPRVWDMPLGANEAKNVYNTVGSSKIATSMRYLSTDQQYKTLVNLPDKAAARVLHHLAGIEPSVVNDLQEYIKQQEAQ